MWLWVETNGTFGVGAPPILEPMLVGVGMFTGVRDFDPWPYSTWSLHDPSKMDPWPLYFGYNDQPFFKGHGDSRYFQNLNSGMPYY